MTLAWGTEPRTAALPPPCPDTHLTNTATHVCVCATLRHRYYETIGGGCGAGPTWNGRSGVQAHMTNTRITDPEIFERRYPVFLREYSFREGMLPRVHACRCRAMVHRWRSVDPPV